LRLEGGVYESEVRETRLVVEMRDATGERQHVMVDLKRDYLSSLQFKNRNMPFINGTEIGSFLVWYTEITDASIWSLRRYSRVILQLSVRIKAGYA
jgi:hypothetical protein